MSRAICVGMSTRNCGVQRSKPLMPSKARIYLGMPKLLLLTAGLLLLPALASASDIYVAQSAAGNANGADCSDAYAISWANNAGNWGSAPNQIGPGTTLHLCGTITGAAGSSGVTVQKSGTSNNPITIKFEAGAVLQAPVWGTSIDSCPNACLGAITINNTNYVVVDGGTNGIIQNTANGTSLSYHQDTIGVTVDNCTGCQVKNLTIQNMYVLTGSTDQSAQDQADIAIFGTASGVLISNNTLKDCRAGIWASATLGGTGLSIYNNTIAHHDWHINIGGSGSPQIFNNDFSDWTNWGDQGGGGYHTDGIIAFGNSASTFTPEIYNNYFHGSIDPNNTGSATAFIYCTYGVAGSGSACTIFNNVFEQDAPAVGAQIWFGTPTSSNAMGPHYAYNNTFINATGSSNYYAFMIYPAAAGVAQQITVENNVANGFGGGYAVLLNGASPSSVFASWNYNDFYNMRSAPFDNHTFAQWQAEGQDTNGSSANPNLDSTYHLQAGSAAIGLGVNAGSTGFNNLATAVSNILNSANVLNLIPLQVGKPSVVGVNGTNDGVARSTSATTWDGGAYPFGMSNAPTPPTSLTATVN